MEDDLILKKKKKKKNWKMIWEHIPMLRASTEHSGNVCISIIKPCYFNLFSFFNNLIVGENEFDL